MCMSVCLKQTVSDLLSCEFQPIRSLVCGHMMKCAAGVDVWCICVFEESQR